MTEKGKNYIKIKSNDPQLIKKIIDETLILISEDERVEVDINCDPESNKYLESEKKQIEVIA